MPVWGNPPWCSRNSVTSLNTTPCRGLARSQDASGFFPPTFYSVDPQHLSFSKEMYKFSEQRWSLLMLIHLLSMGPAKEPWLLCKSSYALLLSLYIRFECMREPEFFAVSAAMISSWELRWYVFSFSATTMCLFQLQPFSRRTWFCISFVSIDTVLMAMDTFFFPLWMTLQSLPFHLQSIH